jgi:hypothetical protein
MFRRTATWLETRSEEISDKLRQFDDSGPLKALGDGQLKQLIILMDTANEDCRDLLREHQNQAPSTFEFSIAAISGIGGIALLDPSMLSLLVTSTGVIATAISTFRRGQHLVAEQRYLGFFWDIENRRYLLQAELARRGIS